MAAGGSEVGYEVVSASGECLYRGADVELACAIYDAQTDPGARLRRLAGGGWRRVHVAPPAAERDDGGDLVDDEVDEVTFWLTAKGYAATERAATRTTAGPTGAGEPGGVFVVDTADVADLARRCPQLFADRSAS
jgi:hypothetical protein